MRLFVALRTDADKNKIFSYEKGLMRVIPGVKWVEKGNLHLTLKFLGETGEDMLDEINERLFAIAKNTEPFDFDYCGISAFPDMFRARVIFVPVVRGEEIVVVMRSIDFEFNQIGFRLEKSYVPHLTLGRVKRETLNLKHFNIKPFQIEKVNALGIALIKSTLTKSGPVYQNISEFDFA